MDNYTDNYIFSYLRKRLSPSEEKTFESALEDDERLSKRTDDLRYLVLAEDLAEMDSTRSFLSASKAKRQPWKKWWVVLVVLIVLPLLWFAYDSQTPTTTFDSATKETEVQEPREKQEKKEFDETPVETETVNPPSAPNKPELPVREKSQEADPSLIFAINVLDTVRLFYSLPKEVIRTVNVPLDSSAFSQALNNLEAGNSQLAIEMLDEILRDEPNNRKAKNAQAHAYFLSENFTASREAFRELRDSAGSLNRDDYDWYLLLATLAEHNRVNEAAEELFQQLIDPNEFHNYQRPAENLRNSIKQ